MRITVKNNSNHGMDLIGNTPEGNFASIEVKASESGYTRGPSGNGNDFTLNRLGQAADGKLTGQELNADTVANATSLLGELRSGTPLEAYWLNIDVNSGAVTVKDW